MNLVPWKSKAARLALQAFGPTVSVQDAYKFAIIYKHNCDMHDELMPTRGGWSKGPGLLPRRYVEFDKHVKKSYRGDWHEIVRIYEDEVVDYLERVIALKTATVTLLPEDDDGAQQDALPAEAPQMLPPARPRLNVAPRERLP